MTDQSVYAPPINTRAISHKQMHAMNRINARKVAGFNIRGRWRWLSTSTGEEFTSQIEALKMRHLVEFSYYTDGKAEVRFTDKGREWYDANHYPAEELLN